MAAQLPPDALRASENRALAQMRSELEAWETRIMAQMQAKLEASEARIRENMKAENTLLPMRLHNATGNLQTKVMFPPNVRDNDLLEAERLVPTKRKLLHLTSADCTTLARILGVDLVPNMTLEDKIRAIQIFLGAV